jgi:hypothetical protein
MKIFGRRYFFTERDVAYFALLAFVIGGVLGVHLALA